MSDGTPRISLHSQLQKTKSWVTLVIGSLVSVILIGFQAAQFLNTLATKEEVEKTRNYVVAENVQLRHELDEEQDKRAISERNIKEIREALENQLENYAGRVAAEKETDKRKAAKAAEVARQKFRESLAKGKSLDEAVSSTYSSWF